MKRARYTESTMSLDDVRATRVCSLIDAIEDLADIVDYDASPDTDIEHTVDAYLGLEP